MDRCDAGVKYNIPKPLAATSVATRIGALPDLKSDTGKLLEHVFIPYNDDFTLQHPVSFLLRFISMYTYCRPSATYQRGKYYFTLQLIQKLVGNSRKAANIVQTLKILGIEITTLQSCDKKATGALVSDYIS